jgi:hypothetical protein
MPIRVNQVLVVVSQGLTRVNQCYSLFSIATEMFISISHVLVSVSQR